MPDKSNMRGSEWFLQESPMILLIHSYYRILLGSSGGIQLLPEGPRALSAPFVTEDRSMTSSKS